MKPILTVLFFCLISQPVWAQKTKVKTPAQTSAATSLRVSDSLFSALSWRNIGPFRGGRSAAVTGVSGKPNLFYFGATGGGVWRTQDGGRTWDNISDGYFGGSIGAIEVAPSDNNVLYVGGGEVTVRGNVSYGSGMWKSEDAGRSWKSIGLKSSRHIPRIRVHPQNPELVYAAVLGDLYQPTEERGIYRSKDGGATWQRILFVNNNTGAVDLCMDPGNPRILYASFWRVRRTPYDLSSGGAGSGLWKSTDAGDTWTELNTNEGFPKDTIGIIGVTVSAARPDRVWALIESASGGLFRSDNGGKSWVKVNEDRSLRQRAWYYTRVYADTKDEDVVYVMNVNYHKSKDGGRTFTTKNAPHGDHHDLWVAPDDPRRMIIGDDGGAQITYDGGETWSSYHNQPTGQFYRLTTDNFFPFRIYAAQQDNTSIRISHRSDGSAITDRDYEPTAGGESGFLAVDPLNPDIIYGGQYHGFLNRLDHKNKSSRSINVWPNDNMGHGAVDAKYRFQWNFPLFFSPHDPKKLYAASNHLHVSTNEGQSWQTISPDLTTNDTSRQQSSGGPITQDNTGVEYYCTIFAAAESPRVKDLLWTGSDDGLVHISRDGGANWTNVTPPTMPKWTMINSIEPDPYLDGGCYLACTAYKLGDYHPYLYRTKDYGKTWDLITEGIDKEDFTRVIRADPKRPGVLYAGTEQGVYVSFTDGQFWQKFQLNLPVVPVTDLLIRDNHLIAATQGRSLWSIDDLSPLQQLTEMPDFLGKGNLAQKDLHLFQPAPAYRMGGGSVKGSKTTGENQPNGSMIYFYLKNKPSEKDTVTLVILENNGDTIKVFSNQKLPAAWEKRGGKLTPKAGGNLFVWNMRYPDAEKFEGLVLWSYGLEGPKAMPGTYQVRISAAGKTATQSFDILPDPRSGATKQIFEQQFEFVQSVSNKISEMHRTIGYIRTLRKQLTGLSEALPAGEQYKPIRVMVSGIDSSMTRIEETFYQTKNRSPQDPLNFPVRLNDKLANLMGLNVEDDFPPTQQSQEVRDELFKQVDEQLAIWKMLREKNLPALNQLIRDSGVDVIRLKE